MTNEEKKVIELALEALENLMNQHYAEQTTSNDLEKAERAIIAIKEALAQPEQEPVAMKFKIYKPTVPDPMRQDINDALLPWVYDQSRGSGFVASMWVTPVSTLPPQRTWVGLTDDDEIPWDGVDAKSFAKAIEAKLKEKNHA